MRLPRILLRGLLHFLAVLLLAFISLVILLIWLTTTETGLAFMVQQLKPLVPGLSIDRSEGALLSGIELSGIDYRDDKNQYHVKKTRLELDYQALWKHQIHFREILLKDINILKPGSGEPTDLSAFALPYDLLVDHLDIQNLVYRQNNGSDEFRVKRLLGQFSIMKKQVNISKLSIQHEQGDLNLGGTIELTGRKAINLNTRWLARIPHQPLITGNGTITGTLDKADIKQSLLTPVGATLNASITDPLGNPVWTLELKTRSFLLSRLKPGLEPWPVSLAMTARGAKDRMEGQGNFSVKMPKFGTINGTLKALFNKKENAIQVETLKLGKASNPGLLELRGKVLNPGPKAQLTIDANWANLAWPVAKGGAWESRKGQVKLTGTPESLRFDASGLINQQPLSAIGGLQLKPDKTVFDQIRVNGKGLELVLNGFVGKTLDASWKLRTDKLESWVPLASGRIESQGTVTGFKDAPAIKGELSATRVAYGKFGIGSLKAKADAGIKPDSPLRLELALQNFSDGKYEADLDFSAEGSRANHRFKGQLDFGRPESDEQAAIQGQLDFNGSGRWQDNGWAGELQRLDPEIPGHTALRLVQPFGLELNASKFELAHACWSGDGVNICLEGERSVDGDWRIESRLSGLPVSRLPVALPATVEANGLLDGEVQLSGSGSRIDHGFLHAGAQEPYFSFQAGNGQSFSFKPDPFYLKLTINDFGADLEFAAEQKGFANLHAHLRAEGPLDLKTLDDNNVRGEAEIEVPSLAFLQGFSKEIDSVVGSLNGQIGIEGSLASPLLKGNGALVNGEARISRLGVTIKNININARSDENQALVFDGQARSGSGTLILNGTFRQGQNEDQGLIATIKGSQFLAADTPEAHVLVSPDLALNFREGQLLITGGVTIPEADIKIPNRPSQVKPSSDVVFVDEELQNPPKSSVFSMASRIDVILGDKVRVEGAGMSGRMIGKVEIAQNQPDSLVGSGEISLVDGKYSYYGVDLDIIEGRILFNKSPVDNPNLVVNVSRKVEDVTVGIKVLGSLKNPETSLYSDRPMQQSDILANLITGRPLSQSSSQEGSQVKDAASGFAGSAGSILAREISSRLGLSDFFDVSVRGSLDDKTYSQGIRSPSATDTSGSGMQSTALFLGKYLTPKLYVQYGMGLFQNIYVFRARYELTKNWKIQTETGQYSGGDILYQWEE